MELNTRSRSITRIVQFCSIQLSVTELFALHVMSKTQVRCDIRARYNTHPDNKWTKKVSSSLFFAGIEVSLNQLTRGKFKSVQISIVF